MSRRKGKSINNAETPNVQPGWYTDPWDRGQLRYFDGRQWTGDVAAGRSAPHEPGFSVPATEQTGYPLSQRVLRFRAIPQRADIDIACSVEDGCSNQLAVIRSVSKVRLVDRDVATISFALLIQPEVPTLYFTRFGGSGSKDSLGITDNVGQELGRLRRTNTFWQSLRSSRMDMSLELGPHVLGKTRVCIDPSSRFAKVNEPIYGSTGQIIASVQREWRYVDMINDFYDYTLECAQPVSSLLQNLILATAFAHYLYDRLAIGGPTESIQRFGHTNRM
ncbi:DUF2510 domain-containing protein [Mycobacterium sp. 21AC1]|uniref:DUF2510 domain-containing protein n=1 Tax=[Mycobacterium] appelbergii TaxID=2939269 RepID=UPI00293918D5|nr:DUF2510 domain-containing protein [Mycobacterium sp. 21AC1]MDV3129505.1 DUF2510 domain-containing protein [Mycobacterium sp. 21AC1]